MLQQLDRITFNPQIMAGQACIRGMRIPVALLLPTFSRLFWIFFIFYNPVIERLTAI